MTACQGWDDPPFGRCFDKCRGGAPAWAADLKSYCKSGSCTGSSSATSAVHHSSNTDSFAQQQHSDEPKGSSKIRAWERAWDGECADEGFFCNNFCAPLVHADAEFIACHRRCMPRWFEQVKPAIDSYCSCEQEFLRENGLLCYGSNVHCWGNQCCPGIPETHGLPFRCPNADD